MNLVRISRHVNPLVGLIVASTVSLPIAASAVTIVVPGTSSPFLAGMPDGSTNDLGDAAPEQSPVQVTGITITPGNSLTFSATGIVKNGTLQPSGSSPDGTVDYIANDNSHNICGIANNIFMEPI